MGGQDRGENVVTAVAEVSLDELLDKGDDVEHLLCSCRPQLMLCGIYDPRVVSIVYATSTDRDCRHCLKVWNSTGCGSCGCRHDWSCESCRLRYAAYTHPS